ncbi:MAG TPA: glycerophosphodiester phosphodiesterase family protein [Xanthomonadaceae bacterium]|nr:glycerophosphodiester phosphodiesterase family protein [Xanthomonadaceae bacterium]
MTQRWPTLDGNPTRVIAHRGASGQLPEHTLEAYALALEQGADAIEPDLVLTRDGVPIARHERGLARSTDIAARSRFAGRAHLGDWHAERLDLSELTELRAVQPFPGRPGDHDGRYAIPTLAQILDLARDWAGRLGREVLVYPELKDPDRLAVEGFDSVTALATVLKGRTDAGVRLWLQCFHEATLERVARELALPTFLLFDRTREPQPTALPDWLTGIGVHKEWIVHAPELVATAHRRGLAVHTWTYRDDAPAHGFDDVAHELLHAFALGVDAVFCDFPATGITTRATFRTACDTS